VNKGGGFASFFIHSKLAHSHKKDTIQRKLPNRTILRRTTLDKTNNTSIMRLYLAVLFLAVPASARRGMPEVPTPPAHPEPHHKGFLPYTWGVTQSSTPLPQGEAEKKVKQVKLVKDNKKGEFCSRIWSSVNDLFD
jgi:hypothetical protein